MSVYVSWSILSSPLVRLMCVRTISVVRRAAHHMCEVIHVDSRLLGMASIDQGHRHSHADQVESLAGCAESALCIDAPDFVQLPQWMATACAVLCLKG